MQVIRTSAYGARHMHVTRRWVDSEVQNLDSSVGDSEHCIFVVGSAAVCIVVQCKMHGHPFSKAPTTRSALHTTDKHQLLDAFLKQQRALVCSLLLGTGRPTCILAVSRRHSAMLCIFDVTHVAQRSTSGEVDAMLLTCHLEVTVQP